MKARNLLLAAGLCLAGTAAVPASADTLLLDLVGSPTTGSMVIGSDTVATYRYTYNLNLVTKGSYIDATAPTAQFTLYDFAGSVSGSQSFTAGGELAAKGDNFVLVPDSGTGFDFSLVGPTYINPDAPLDQRPSIAADDAGFANLTYRFTGSNRIDNVDGNPVFLGQLSLTSLRPLGGQTAYTVDYDTSHVNGPNYVLSPDVSAPGPGVLAPTPAASLAGTGLLSLMGLARRRRRA
jgi:hypothetical protein